MNKYSDRITEAYNNELGEEFGKEVRERIHWICMNAKGTRILDVGCSQGITSILLAREAKNVLGIDTDIKSIEYAIKSLENEQENTKKYIDFKLANFVEYDFDDEKFDSIILGELLEHVIDTERFIRKASDLINKNGQIIITVPFGINDFHDHKKTYYLANLIEDIDAYLKVINIKYFGFWIGLVTTKKDNKEGFYYDQDIVMQLEKAFNYIESYYIKEIDTKNDRIKILNTCLDAEKKKNIDFKKANLDLKQEILERIESEEGLLDSYKKELIIQSNFQENCKDIEKKYAALKESKLGRLTLFYWDCKRKIFRFK